MQFRCIKDYGQMENKMVQEFILAHQKLKRKENGKMEKEYAGLGKEDYQLKKKEIENSLSLLSFF